MKTQTMRMATCVHNKFFAFTVAAFLMTGSASLNAQSTALANTAVVKHLGNTEETMSFQVQYENTSGEKFAVIVRDQEGNVLFQENYNNKKFDKKFQLPKIDNNKVTFQIKNVKESTQQTFEINTNTRFVEEVIVKKVN